MTLGERINPPFYDELFAGFAGMAAVRGAVNYDPLDSSFEPGDDGTLTPEGEPAPHYEYEVRGNELPDPVKDLDIDQIKVVFNSRMIFGGQINPERVSAEAHLLDGTSKTLSLIREKDGEINALLWNEADNDEEEPSGPSIGEGLSDSERQAILFDVLGGNTDLLEEASPAGELARSIFLRVSTLGPPDIDDIELFCNILHGLDPEGEFQNPS